MIGRQIPTAASRRAAWHAAARSVCDRPAGRLACGQGFVLTPAQARAAGLADKDVRRLVRRHEWAVPRRGVLCVLPPPASGVPWQAQPHGLRPEVLAAAAALVRPDALISHECAALGYGLDVLRTPRQATLTTPYRLHAGSRGGAIVRAAAIDDTEIVRWFGTSMTSCARTVADIARRGVEHGLVVADSALRAGLLSRDELASALEHERRWHGVVGARRVLELASALSESPLESRVRLFLADHDLPLPRQQARIETHRGWYRVDGLWVEQRVVLEADGLVKYRTDPDARAEEKLRHEALDRAGFRIVRVVAEDLGRYPVQTVRRICDALRITG